MTDPEAATKLLAIRKLADRLEEISDLCASRAVERSEPVAYELLARATTYQECAGLIREALK